MKLKVKVFSIGLTLVVLMVIFLTLTSCAKPTDAPETRCFTTPYLYCSQLADWDGE